MFGKSYLGDIFILKLNNLKCSGNLYILRCDGRDICVSVHPYGVVMNMSTTRECNLLPAVFFAKYSLINKQEVIGESKKLSKS